MEKDDLDVTNEPLSDEDLIRELLLPLITQPDKLHIEKNIELNDTRLKIFVDPSDRGRVIGKGGIVLDTLRTYFRLVAQAERRRIFVELFEPDRIKRSTLPEC